MLSYKKRLFPQRKQNRTMLGILFLFSTTAVMAQRGPASMTPQKLDPIVEQIVAEANNNSQLEKLAFELLDVVGPRLVGTPGMTKANEWAVKTFQDWGIEAYNEQFGEWRGWERGISYIDMTYPRLKTLHGTQLAWSPSTKGKAVEAEAIIFPEVKDSLDFQRWLPNAKGKMVMISMYQPSGRTAKNWEEYARPESLEKMKKEKDSLNRAFSANLRRTGFGVNAIPQKLEEAGALGIISSYWSQEFGANKIFGARTLDVPSVDVSLEDYGVLYRLAKNGIKPKVRIQTSSKDLGNVPSFNTIATIKGVEKPEEYVILSAHLDSWEGGSGATDNGTGTIAMMEVARILKKLLPNPKRTILIGLWGSEEQGLNGSRAFVLDNPAIVEKTQAVFNLDNGTGRVDRINGSGFLHAYDFIGRWMSAAPREITRDITTTFPGSPGGGGSDHASFVAAGVPAFMLSALSWDYFTATWHTNLDTYDKLVFDDLKYNVILTAVMTYKAAQEDQLVNREKIVLPESSRGGWPAIRQPRRTGVGY